MMMKAAAKAAKTATSIPNSWKNFARKSAKTKTRVGSQRRAKKGGQGQGRPTKETAGTPAEALTTEGDSQGLDQGHLPPGVIGETPAEAQWTVGEGLGQGHLPPGAIAGLAQGHQLLDARIGTKVVALTIAGELQGHRRPDASAGIRVVAKMTARENQGQGHLKRDASAENRVAALMTRRDGLGRQNRSTSTKRIAAAEGKILRRRYRITTRSKGCEK